MLSPHPAIIWISQLPSAEASAVLELFLNAIYAAAPGPEDQLTGRHLDRMLGQAVREVLS